MSLIFPSLSQIVRIRIAVFELFEIILKSSEENFIAEKAANVFQDNSSFGINDVGGTGLGMTFDLAVVVFDVDDWVGRGGLIVLEGSWVAVCDETSTEKMLEKKP